MRPKTIKLDKLNIGFLEARCAFQLLQLLLEKIPCLLRLEYIAWCIESVIIIRKARIESSHPDGSEVNKRWLLYDFTRI